MAIRYIDVTAKSDLFIPATRAYGNIAIVGKGATGATATVGEPVTDLSAPPTATNDPFRGDLSAAITMAFSQTPGPAVVHAVRVDDTNPDWDAALAAVAKLDAQIVVIANTPFVPGASSVTDKLATHVSTVSTSGGDGKERIGVVMLKKDADDGSGVTANERMVYVAHRSDDDVAAAVAGVIAGYEPHISMLLKPVNVKMSTAFSDEQIVKLDTVHVNWLTDPVLFPGRGIFMGEGYTVAGDSTKRYIDVIRTLDDITFQLKASLMQTIGALRMSRSGLRGVVTLAESILSPLQAREVIESFAVHLPLLDLLDKDPSSTTDAEIQQINSVQATRRVDLLVTVEYAGAIHRLHIDLVLK